MNKVIFTLLFLAFWMNANARVEILKETIRIDRDEWGVPHIHAPLDEEVAYGLAWATATDDFKSIQENYLAARGRLGTVQGKDGAILDFLSLFLGIDQIVEDKIDQAFSAKYRKLLELYCQGINDYAEANPKEVLRKELFPITIKDIVCGYTLSMALMTNVHSSLIKIMQGEISSEALIAPKGSNALAIRKNKTDNGKSFLMVNSHQPLSGPYSWYEAHLQSDEGWNMIGGVFPGGVTIFHGANDSLGWAHTISYADMDDVYQLKMHPTEKLKYLYDGEWLKLEEKKIRLKVKWWLFQIPVKRTVYESVYGPTMRSKDGNYYSIRYASSADIESGEQWYRMNKAKNFQEFQQALEQQHIKGLNVVYADARHNIYYLDNGAFPKRNSKYDWWNILPGDTSATLWSKKEFLPLSDLLQIKNPSCGFVFNTNNSPFLSTGKKCQADESSTPAHTFYFPYQNNRSLRMYELLTEIELFSYEDFKRLKYDQKFGKPAYTYSMANIENVFELSEKQYPDLKEVLELIQTWDRVSDVDSYGATIVNLFSSMYIRDLVKKIGIPVHENYLTEEEIVTYLRKTQDHLMKYFGTVKIPLGDVQKLVRGDKEIPVGGMMDVIAAMHNRPHIDGKYRIETGESYIMMIQWDKNGPTIETISPFGASSHPDSPHYSDQMDLFVAQKLKPMSLNYFRDQGIGTLKQHALSR